MSRSPSGREAATLTIGKSYPGIETIALVIAHSQIVLAVPAAESAGAGKFRSLPAGFGEVDVAILEWIGTERRSLGRGVARH